MSRRMWRRWRERRGESSGRNPRRRRPRIAPGTEPLEVRRLLSVDIAGVPQWLSQGPQGPLQNSVDFGAIGAVESLAVQPIAASDGTVHDVVFAGTANGGIWRAGTEFTSNGVDHWFGDIAPDLLTGGEATRIAWFPLSDNQPSLSTSSLALDPTNPHPPDPAHITLWVGTGSLSSSLQGSRGAGLLKTTDGGLHWTVLGQGGSRPLTGDRIESVVPTTVRDPGTGQQVVLVASLEGGILRSTDGGQTFGPVSIVGQSGDLDGTATSLIADPTNPNRFYAGIAHHGVFASDDAGQSWVEIDHSEAGMTGADGIKLAAQASGTQTVLFAATEATDVLIGKQVITPAFLAGVPSASPIGGAPGWTTIGDVPFFINGKAQVVHPFAEIEDGKFTAAADPASLGTFYVASAQGNVFRVDVTSDHPWVQLDGDNGEPKIHDDQRTLAFLGDGSLLVANDGGIYGLNRPLTVGMSNGTGQQWTALNAGLRDNEMYSATYDPTTNLIFGASQDNSVEIQTGPNSADWTLMPDPRGDGFETAVDTGGNHYYVENQTVIRDGTEVALAGLNTADRTYFTSGGFTGQAIAASSITARDIMVGRTDIYESTNGGDTVTDLTPSDWNGDVPDAGAGQFNVVKNIAFAPEVGGAAYVSTFVNGIGGGRLWVRASSGSPFTEVGVPWKAGNFNVASIAVDPYDYRTAYFLLTDGEVWEKSLDAQGQTTWTDLTDNLRDDGLFPLYDDSLGRNLLAVCDPHPTAAGQGMLLLGAQGGVYGHRPGTLGLGWKSVGNALPNVPVTGIEYAKDADLLLVSTLGRGAWILQNASASILSAAPRALTVTADDSQHNHIVITSSDQVPGCVEIILNDRLEYSGPASGASSITVDGDASDTTVDVEDALFGVPIDVNEGSGPETVNITPKSGSFRRILDDVTINPGSGRDILNVYDTRDTAGDDFTLTAGTIDDGRSFGGTVRFSGQAAVNVLAGSGHSTFVVRGTSSAPTTIDTKTAADDIDVRATTGPLLITSGRDAMARGDRVTVGEVDITDRILGDVAISTPSGLTDLVVDDSHDASGPTMTIGADRVTRAGRGSVIYPFGNIRSLTIDGGSGGNEFDVGDTPHNPSDTLRTIVNANAGLTRVLGTTGPLTVNGGYLVDLGDGDTSRLLGDVRVGDAGGPVPLTVDDGRDGSGPKVTLADGSIAGLSVGTITYGAGVSGLTVYGGSGPSVFNVLGTTGTPFFSTILNAGGGSTTVLGASGYLEVVGGRSARIGQGDLTGIAGPVWVHEPAFSGDTMGLEVDDSGDRTGRKASLDPSFGTNVSLNNLATGQILYDGAAVAVQIDGGPLANQFTVNTTGSMATILRTGGGTAIVLGTGGPLEIDGGDAVQVGPGDFTRIRGSVTILNAPGLPAAIRLTVDASGVAGPESVVIDHAFDEFDAIIGLTSHPIAYLPSAVASVTLIGGPGANNGFNVAHTVAGTPVTVDGRAGKNTFAVGRPYGSIAAIQGGVTLIGSGADTLEYDDSGNSAGATYNYGIAADTLGRTGSASVTYRGMGPVRVHAADAGAAGNNYLNIYSTAAEASYDVYAGTGFNEFTVSNPADTLDGIRGSLYLHGSGGPLPNNNLAIVDDDLNPVGHTYLLTAGATPASGTVQRVDIARIQFEGLNGGFVLGTARVATDVVNVQSESPQLFMAILTGTGDTVTVGSQAPALNGTLAGIAGNLRIQAAAGQTPRVILDDSGNTSPLPRTIDVGGDSFLGYTFSGLAAGRLGLLLDPAAPVTLRGGGPVDTYHFRDFRGAPALRIEDGGGNDTLDYSAYTGDIAVDLARGTATGLAGGIWNVPNVTGSIGNDLIVGDAGANRLIGGTGRNILIGGAGADRLTGGGGDNILIGGYTSYDATNPQALGAIMAEWTSGDDIATRQRKIRNGIVVNGNSYALSTSGGGRTVFDDGSPDVLTGSLDPKVVDWFFYNDANDQLVNADRRRDTLTQVR